MQRLDASARSSLRSWLLPDRPGPLVGLHVLASGIGDAWVDRWPDPRVSVWFTGGNLAFAGDAEALDPDALARRLGELLGPWVRVMIEAAAPFLRALRRAAPSAERWPRVILALDAPAPALEPPTGIELARLEPRHAAAIRALDPALAWISDTWDGPETCAARSGGWGALLDGRLAALAVPFFVGERYEDIGVVTQPDARRRGLSSLCAARLCADIRSRGRVPSWSTTPDNAASLAVATRLGFERVRDDALWVVEGSGQL